MFKCYRKNLGQVTVDMIPPKEYNEGCLIIKRAPAKEGDLDHNDYDRELAFAMGAVELGATLRVIRGTNKEGQVKFIHKHPSREGITTTLQFERVEKGLKIFIAGTPRETAEKGTPNKENYVFTLNPDEAEVLHSIMWHAIPQILGIPREIKEKKEG